LGIPTVADRVAQEIARRYLEPVFHGSLAKFTVIRRASSRVSRFGRRSVRRCDSSGIGGRTEVRGLRPKRR
jgi:hypothetical protein